MPIPMRPLFALAQGQLSAKLLVYQCFHKGARPEGRRAPYDAGALRLRCTSLFELDGSAGVGELRLDLFGLGL
jgi:hypothetical protein